MDHRHGDRARTRRMIENIDIERCTGCGICDAVCPADVIHMEAGPVGAGDRRAHADQAAAGDQVPRALHHLLQLRDLLSRADRRRASLGQEPAAALVSSDGEARRRTDRDRRPGGRRRRRRADRGAQRQAPWRLRHPRHAARFLDDRPHRPHRVLQCLDDRRAARATTSTASRARSSPATTASPTSCWCATRSSSPMRGSRTSKRSA